MIIQLMWIEIQQPIILHVTTIAAYAERRANVSSLYIHYLILKSFKGKSHKSHQVCLNDNKHISQYWSNSEYSPFTIFCYLFVQSQILEKAGSYKVTKIIIMSTQKLNPLVQSQISKKYISYKVTEVIVSYNNIDWRIIKPLMRTKHACLDFPMQCHNNIWFLP